MLHEGQKGGTWSVSRKRRNKEVYILNGNHRIVNVNLGRKGLKLLKKLVLELDPDVMVVTEPGYIGARPNIKGFDIIRHRSIVILAREKSVQVNSHEIVKIHTKVAETKPRDSEGEGEGGTPIGQTAKKVRFDVVEEVEAGCRRGEGKKTPIREFELERMEEGRILKTSIRMGGVAWLILSIYGPQRADPQRKAFWQTVNDLVSSQACLSQPVCLLGDFNAIANEDEVIELVSAKTLVEPYLAKWEEETKLLDLWKLHSTDKGITRFKETGSAAGSRIDRIMVSLRAKKVLKRSHVRVGERVSDHAPLIWDFSLISDADWRPVVAFNNSQLNWSAWSEKTSANWKEWLKKESFVASSLLHLPPPERCHLFEKFLRKCHAKLYSLIGVGNNIIRMSKKKRQAEKSKDPSASTKAHNKIKEDFKKRILRKKRGEGNKEIFAIKDERGEWCEGAKMEEFIAGTLKHFGPREPVAPGWGENRSPLSTEEQIEMSKPPTLEEVRQVIQGLKKKKATLKDDLPGWILKESGEELLERCLEIIQTIWENPDVTPQEWTRSVIRLVPKNGRDSSLLPSWRPIAVGSTIHKIIFTIWAKRLERMALKKMWLHPAQYGFIKGRTAKGAADVTAHLLARTKNPLVLQWDIEKAFPSLSPVAVATMLKNLGIPDGFCAILLSFYTSSQSMAIIGGVPGGQKGLCKWTNEWGLKQGCPASPLLLNLWTFPIVSEMAEKTNFLQYADDMWAISEEKEEERVKALLRTLVVKAGLVINEEKMKRWTPRSEESLVMMGMIVQEGRKETVAKKVDKILGPSILRGVERELVGWKKVAYINTIVIPRLRYVLSTFWEKNLFKEAREIDEVLRSFCKCQEWPSYADNDFLYDSVMGLGLHSLEEEIAKDLICYVWRLAGQGAQVEDIWKEAWAAYQAGGSPLRVMLWKEAVEFLTDLEVQPDMYRAGRCFPFPLGQGGHLHRSTLSQVFTMPAKEVFEQNGCIEAWDSLQNPEALRVWTDASVMTKGAAAAVLIETCAPTSRGKEELLLERIQQKIKELNLNLAISHVDKDSQGRVRGRCLICNKTFDVFTRIFLSRGPTKCECGVDKPTLEERVRGAADMWGNLDLYQIGSDWRGRVHGSCRQCHQPFEVAIRTFLYRGPTKCSCLTTTSESPQPSPPQLSGTETMTEAVKESCHLQQTSSLVFPPSSIICFPVRGNSFRSEGLGLIGAKKLLIERGNLEGKKEVHFLCDNKANIDLHRQMQKDLNRTTRHFIFKDNQQLEAQLLRMWSAVKYIFVKGHIGIPQNEVCDERAKKEVMRCTEGIVDEAIESFGDIRNRGMRLESRRELAVQHKWMTEYMTEMMKCCRSHMAKRVQIGIERWKGNISIFHETPASSECSWCDCSHGQSFFEMVLECPKLSSFRQEVKDRWKKVLNGESFDSDLFFGKIRRSLVAKLSQGKDEKKVWKEMTQNLRWWERRLSALRKEMKEISAESESDESETEEKPSPMETLAKKIRVVDEGMVKKGEPDILFPECGKRQLKSFLSQRKRSS